jgi:eukaryotic-like serine/threonine-protein kinase
LDFLLRFALARERERYPDVGAWGAQHHWARATRAPPFERASDRLTLLYGRRKMLFEAGHVIDGKYRLVRLIGTGGMGSVYEGENLLIRRRVAIKILHAGSTGNVDAIRRFEREAQAAGEIGNDHILEVLDLGSLADGDRYMVMEYLDGETLAARIERHGRLTPGQIAPIARQFLTALASAHAAGIIHRDLKPENIFILRAKAGRVDFVKLIDFGISKFSRPFAEDEHRMTRADAVLGTPCYMSPEQARGARETDVRSDIYSCGVILFESVTGRLPFEGDSFNDLMFKIALSDAPSPLTFVPSLDPDFAWLINHAIARDPERRFATAQEFAEALDDWMRKHALTETLALPLPADAYPSRVESPGSKDADTLSLDGAGEALGLEKTAAQESWSQSHGDATAALRRRRRTPRIAAASIGGLAAVGLAIALMVRSDPTPAVAHAGPGATASAATLPDGSARSVEAPVPGADPSALRDGVAGGIPAASASTREPVAKVVATHAAPAAAEKPDKPKPKAAASAKGFDLGY